MSDDRGHDILNPNIIEVNMPQNRDKVTLFVGPGSFDIAMVEEFLESTYGEGSLSKSVVVAVDIDGASITNIKQHFAGNDHIKAVQADLYKVEGVNPPINDRIVTLNWGPVAMSDGFEQFSRLFAKLGELSKAGSADVVFMNTYDDWMTTDEGERILREAVSGAGLDIVEEAGSYWDEENVSDELVQDMIFSHQAREIRGYPNKRFVYFKLRPRKDND